MKKEKMRNVLKKFSDRHWVKIARSAGAVVLAIGLLLAQISLAVLTSLLSREILIIHIMKAGMERVMIECRRAIPRMLQRRIIRQNPVIPTV